MRRPLVAVIVLLGSVVWSGLAWPGVACAETLTGIPALRAMVGDGQYQLAIDGARTMLTQQVSDPVTLAGARGVMAEATRGLAQQARSEGRLSDAVSLARGLVDALPNQPESFALLAETLSAAGQASDADAALKRALDLGPASAAVHVARAAVAADRGELPVAVAALRQAVALAPGDVEAGAALARALALSGKLTEAVEVQRRVVTARPAAGQRNRLALLQILAGDLDGAEATVKETLEQAAPSSSPTPPEEATFDLPWLGIRVTYATRGAADIIDYRRYTLRPGFHGGRRIRHGVVVSVRPGSPAEKAGFQRADLILRVQGVDLGWKENPAIFDAFHQETADGSLEVVVQRRNREARKEEEVTLRAAGATRSLGSAAVLASRVEPVALRARILLRRGSAVRALRDVEESLKETPNSFALRYTAALCHRATGEYQKVLDVTEPLSRLIVDDWLGNGATKPLERAIAQAKLGRAQEALAEWDTVLKKGGLLSCPLYVAARAELRSALDADGLARRVQTSSELPAVLDALGTLRRLAWTPAEEAAVRDLALAWGRRQRPAPALPEEARNHLLRMQVFLREKDAEAARREIAAAIDLAPWEPSLYYNAALVAAGAEDYRRAVAFMTTYVGACPTAPDAAQARDQMVQWGALADRKDQGH